MILKNGKIFQEQGAFHEGSLYIKNDKIAETADGEVIDVTGLYVIPGLMDIHFHGCAGYDFCDGTPKALAAMAEYELKSGITGICPASMTLPEAELANIFKAAAAYKAGDNENGADILGIHMEGPFLSMEKRGAQNGSYIQKPNEEMFLQLQKAAEGLIKICDIAPETEGTLACIEKISDQVIVSLAHTCADYTLAMKAFDAGAKHVTHLYNGMMPFSHRAPGVVGAAGDRGDVYVELIADGVHVHPAVVRSTFRIFGDDRIVMISDSMRATGLKDGNYILGGQGVTVKGNLAALTEDGTIAGSVTNLMDCIRVAVKEMKIPLESAVKCATVNPAKAIGVFDRYGSLAVGKQANVVVLDEQMEIKYIIKDGERYRFL